MCRILYSGGPPVHKPQQILYKFVTIIENCPVSARINLIGHSIGAYICLQIAGPLAAHGFNVHRILNLFPTIERMADSPNGRVFQLARKCGILWFTTSVQRCEFSVCQRSR
jgi:hypothetical protein